MSDWTQTVKGWWNRAREWLQRGSSAAGKWIDLQTEIGKRSAAIRRLQGEREKLIKQIGEKVYTLHTRGKVRNKDVLADCLKIDEILGEIERLRKEIEELRRQMRAAEEPLAGVQDETPLVEEAEGAEAEAGAEEAEAPAEPQGAAEAEGVGEAGSEADQSEQPAEAPAEAGPEQAAEDIDITLHEAEEKQAEGGEEGEGEQHG